MLIERWIEDRLLDLKAEANYRVFAELERHRGRFPQATRHVDKDASDVTVWCSGQGCSRCRSRPCLPCGGLAGDVTGRTGPAHVNPVISHRHPDICADETRGRAIPPARAGADPRPGNNGVAPREQDGAGKTGSPDRRRDLPDLMRRTGAGFQGTGTSGGSRPISGILT